MAAIDPSIKVTKANQIEEAGLIVNAWVAGWITRGEIIEYAARDTKAEGISRSERLQIFGSRYAIEVYLGR